MTMQSARDFLARMRGEPALAERMAGLASDEERRALALSLGFVFTAAELDAVGNELPDEALARINAGHNASSCGKHVSIFTIG